MKLFAYLLIDAIPRGVFTHKNGLECTLYFCVYLCGYEGFDSCNICPSQSGINFNNYNLNKYAQILYHVSNIRKAVLCGLKPT